MRRLIIFLALVLLALPLWESYSAVGSYHAVTVSKAPPKDNNPIAQMDCSSQDPKVIARCAKELTALTNYVTANNNEAMNWIRRKSANPKALKEAMDYCAETIAPDGQMPNFEDLHRCARQRLGP